MRYNRASLDDTTHAATRAAIRRGRTVYVYATALGWTIEFQPPLGYGGRYLVVTPDGGVREVA